MTKLVKYIANAVVSLIGADRVQNLEMEIEDAEEALSYNKDLSYTTEGRAIQVVNKKVADKVADLIDEHPQGKSRTESFSPYMDALLNA